MVSVLSQIDISFEKGLKRKWGIFASGNFLGRLSTVFYKQCNWQVVSVINVMAVSHTKMTPNISQRITERLKEALGVHTTLQLVRLYANKPMCGFLTPVSKILT